MMKSFLPTLALLLTAFYAVAVDIPQGTFYFDNSKTQYSNVKFVYGSDTSNETHIVSMTHEGNDVWKITIDSTVSNMYRYTFANTSLSDGFISDTFTNVKNDISNNRNEKRTATTDAAITPGYIFTPTSGDNWAQGSWIPLKARTTPYSATLPVLFINTENNQPITSKEDYLNATYYLDNMGLDGYKSFGSKDEPLPLQIKGRGNYTWTGFDKKPYRLKLGSKAALLGMNKSKHFALLAHADDNMAFLRNTVGFEVSRLIGLPYTPSQQPVEVMLNGSYIGLYMLTETIRVDADRVNITEQPDSATNADEITGGWLVEIDNYDETEQVRITEGNGEIIRFTYKTPELLSAEQRNYLTSQVTNMNTAIYSSNKQSTAWEGYIDLNTLARFYIIQEVMDNAESFHGSCYLYKDQGIGKWYFGPVWDFGNSFHRGTDKFIYVDSPFGQTWIGEIAKYPRFQQAVVDIWKNFKGNEFWRLPSFVDNFIAQITTAAQYDARRWPKYGNANPSQGKSSFMNYLNQKAAWLVKQWGEGIASINDATNDTVRIACVNQSDITVTATSSITDARLYTMSGTLVAQCTPDADECTISYPATGIYVVTVTTADGRSFHQKVIVR